MSWPHAQREIFPRSHQIGEEPSKGPTIKRNRGVLREQLSPHFSDTSPCSRQSLYEHVCVVPRGGSVAAPQVRRCGTRRKLVGLHSCFSRFLPRTITFCQVVHPIQLLVSYPETMLRALLLSFFPRAMNVLWLPHSFVSVAQVVVSDVNAGYEQFREVKNLLRCWGLLYARMSRRHPAFVRLDSCDWMWYGCYGGNQPSREH